VREENNLAEVKVCGAEELACGIGGGILGLPLPGGQGSVASAGIICPPSRRSSLWLVTDLSRRVPSTWVLSGAKCCLSMQKLSECCCLADQVLLGG
jgi:hypothetical protein